MSRTNFYWNRRAVNPITSSLIVLAITVIAMLLAISYSQTIIEERRDQMTERLCVEKTIVNSTHIVLFLRNISNQEIILTHLIINGTYNEVNPRIYLPSMETNAQFLPTKITWEKENGNGMVYIKFFTSRNNELGKIEVDYN